MNSPTLEELIQSFHAAWDKKSWVGIAVAIPGNSGLEIIMSPASAWVDKLKYYQQAYDESLEHKHAKGIKIVNWAFGNSFEDIQRELNL